MSTAVYGAGDGSVVRATLNYTTAASFGPCRYLGPAVSQPFSAILGVFGGGTAILGVFGGETAQKQLIIFIRYRASRPTLHINPTITSPHTHYIPSDPRAAGASFSSFSSSRQASVFDLLPSPAALATRAEGEGSPPHAATAPSQRRPSSASSLAHRQPVQPPVGAWHRLSI